MSISLTLSNATPFNSPVAHPLARALTPHMDRRAHTDRRTPLKPMPVVERSWASHALVAGCLGALLGSTAAFAVLQKHQIDAAGHAVAGTVAEAALPAAAVMAPLFDTTPFAASSLKSEPTASAANESYSEDAAGVPSATYHEPPKMPMASAAR
jgi:hypothetical protein